MTNKYRKKSWFDTSLCMSYKTDLNDIKLEHTLHWGAVMTHLHPFCFPQCVKCLSVEDQARRVLVDMHSKINELKLKWGVK